MHICCLINASLSEMLLDGLTAFRERFGTPFSLAVHYGHEIEEERVPSSDLTRDLERADLVLLDLRGSGRAVQTAARALRGTENTVVALVGGSPEIMGLVRMGSFSLAEAMRRAKGGRPATDQGPNIQRIQNIMRWAERLGGALPVGMLRHVRNWNRAMRYWGHGGGENVCNLLVFLGREYLKLDLPKPEEPREYPEHGLWDPNTGKFHETVEEYRSVAGYDPDKPTVALLLYGGMHFSQSAVGVRALAERLAPKHNLLPVYSQSHANFEAARAHLFENGRPRARAMAYYQWFQFATFGKQDKDTIPLFRGLDMPVFAMAPMYGRETGVWRENVQGLSPIEVMTTVIMPELDGMIEPVPSLGLNEETDAATGMTVKRVRAIPDQIDFIARRMTRRVALGRKPRAERRVAFIIYDNPPGEDNIGNTSYLDVFASVRACVAALDDQGYTTRNLPSNKEICARFIETGAVNNARWTPEGKSLEQAVTIPVSEYLPHYQALADPAEVASEWGAPPGEIMAGKGHVILPCLEYDNVLLGLQPCRGIHSEPDKITHDKTLPPHHQYIAFYRWLEHGWGADAVIHVGTHGTLEFLKGKEVGQSADCWPANLIGSVPHLYIYHVVNPSEAMIAKRRSLGTIVNYNSPPLTVSEVYEGYDDLERLIEEYVEARAHDQQRAERLEAKVRDRAVELGFQSEDAHMVQEEVALMKRSLIPKGLHVMGQIPNPAQSAETVAYFLRYDRGETPSLQRCIAQNRNLDYDALLDDPGGATEDRRNSRFLEELDAKAMELVRASLEAGRPIDERYAPSLDWALDIFQRMGGSLEITALLHGLDGGYTEPGIGGEPCRDPDTLPTGRNTYQFDPRLVPSETAYLRGREIAENTLAHYHDLHGEYPESTAVVLWAFETAKTRGETVGQVFGYLGVRPVRKGPWHTDLEIIPTGELGRPRIDVTVQICGFFRDMFAGVISLMNRAFELVAALDEGPEQNFVRPHTEAALKKLLQNNGDMDQAKARRVAASRVFGPRPGEYGSRVTHLIETAAWKSEQDIVDTFMASMNHLYADNIHGERQENIYRDRLAGIQMVSQVRDTHDYEIADLDHYYEYFGGLTRSVEAVRGEAPVQLITDTTGERIRTETQQASFERGIRTRLLNPKWIDHMLEHEVHGAQKVAERVENLVGFSATTHVVKDWVYSGVAERYLFDQEMFERMKENNLHATEEITRRLFEAQRRGYWQADEEEMRKLSEAYMELEGDIEDTL